MLPDFPKLRKEMSSHLMLKLHATVQEKEPILADIRGVTQHEGDIIAYDQLTGEGVRIVTEGFKEVQSAFVTRFEEVPSLVGERLDTKLAGIADDIARHLSESFRQTMDTTTREAGTAIDAGGALSAKSCISKAWKRLR
jgi:hypothetical protein